MQWEIVADCQRCASLTAATGSSAFCKLTPGKFAKNNLGSKTVLKYDSQERTDTFNQVDRGARKILI